MPVNKEYFVNAIKGLCDMITYLETKNTVKVGENTLDIKDVRSLIHSFSHQLSSEVRRVEQSKATKDVLPRISKSKTAMI